MSMMYCHYCNKLIDTDWDAEHFMDEEMEWDENNCIEKQEDECA